MIVVDSNVIAYCWIHGERTALAHRLRRLDPDWHAPVLWRSELRNILTGYRRDRSLSEPQVRQIMAAAEAGLAGREHHLPSERVFAVTETSRLSAYDSEFVALAEILGVRLVTEDRAILAGFPGRALNLDGAVGVQ
ncbi:MAG: type II toxin-antitoxin system VapC family toxin [Steroidobacteraceae bacterium]|nr:type II toxin-antitoxin system VapC family toxin [Steroidobacteraceae bacterium]